MSLPRSTTASAKSSTASSYYGIMGMHPSSVNGVGGGLSGTINGTNWKKSTIKYLTNPWMVAKEKLQNSTSHLNFNLKNKSGQCNYLTHYQRERVNLLYINLYKHLNFLILTQVMQLITRIRSQTLEYLLMETTTKSNPPIEMEDKYEISMDYRTTKGSKNYMVRLMYFYISDSHSFIHQ